MDNHRISSAMHKMEYLQFAFKHQRGGLTSTFLMMLVIVLVT